MLKAAIEEEITTYLERGRHERVGDGEAFRDERNDCSMATVDTPIGQVIYPTLVNDRSS